MVLDTASPRVSGLSLRRLLNYFTVRRKLHAYIVKPWEHIQKLRNWGLIQSNKERELLLRCTRYRLAYCTSSLTPYSRIKA